MMCRQSKRERDRVNEKRKGESERLRERERELVGERKRGAFVAC